MSKLRNITEFCPKEMQIKNPGGFSVDVDAIAAIESYTDADDCRLIIHYNRFYFPGEKFSYLPGSKTTIKFYRNVDGSPPDVYSLHRNLDEARNDGD